MIILNPTLVDFPKIGTPATGYISLAEKEHLPFEVKRIYWTYFTPDEIERGGHSHFELQQILVAVAGIITISTEMLTGEKAVFVLDSPSKGLLIPKLCWREMKYSHNAVQMCIASIAYEESDYIRKYEDFQKLKLNYQ